jgi:hypothetical protein
MYGKCNGGFVRLGLRVRLLALRNDRDHNKKNVLWQSLVRKQRFCDEEAEDHTKGRKASDPKRGGGGEREREIVSLRKIRNSKKVKLFLCLTN